MTVAEKADKIREHCCSHKKGCDECVLYPYVKDSARNCYTYLGEGDAEIIAENYDIIFGKPKGHCPNVPNSNVNHPSHYNQGGIECIDAMVAAFGKEAIENFCLCNAFKYVWRNRDKNGFEDIDKAIWYLEKIKELCSDE